MKAIKKNVVFQDKKYRVIVRKRKDVYGNDYYKIIIRKPFHILSSYVYYDNFITDPFGITKRAFEKYKDYMQEINARKERINSFNSWDGVIG